jgi:hypothetical protein
MSEVYKIAVQLSMMSNAPAFLSMQSHQLLGVHTKVKDLEKGFGRLHAAIGGGIAVAAGAAILSTYGMIADHGIELLDQQDKLIRAARMPRSPISRLTHMSASQSLSQRLRGLTFCASPINCQLSGAHSQKPSPRRRKLSKSKRCLAT